MPVTLEPRLTRIEMEFPEAGKVRVRLYCVKAIDEPGEDKVIVAVPAQGFVVPDSDAEVAAWLTYVLAQAKTEFNRTDLVYDYPA